MTVVVKPVREKREQKQFLELPWQIYKGYEHWIPPLRMDQRERAGFTYHPFYEENQGQAFIATRGDQVVGRVTAIVNHEHNRRYSEKRGFLGLFESVDDQEVANQLFLAASHWLKEQGMTDMRGPCSPSLNYECGLLIDGFDIPPTFMMPYNPPYYQQLWEQFGFEKADDMYSFWGHVDMVETLDKKMAFVIEEAKRRFDIKLRPLNKKHFGREVKMFLDIYNKSLVGTWGFTPLSPAEIKTLSTALRFLIVPEMTSVAKLMESLWGRFSAIGLTILALSKLTAGSYR